MSSQKLQAIFAGYFTKDTQVSRLVNAVRTAAQGGVVTTAYRDPPSTVKRLWPIDVKRSM